MISIVIHNSIRSFRLERELRAGNSERRFKCFGYEWFSHYFTAFSFLLWQKFSETTSDWIRRTLESHKVKRQCWNADHRKDHPSRLCRGVRTAKQWTLQIPRGKKWEKEKEKSLCCSLANTFKFNLDKRRFQPGRIFRISTRKQQETNE